MIHGLREVFALTKEDMTATAMAVISARRDVFELTHDDLALLIQTVIVGLKGSLHGWARGYGPDSNGCVNIDA